MIRSGLIFLALLLLIILGFNALSDPGQLSLIWLGFRVDMAMTTSLILIGILTLMALGFWSLVIWMMQAPQRAAQRSAESRRRQGEEVLTRGFIAVATGEGAEARRLAVKAIDTHDNVALVRILGAMAAEAADDTEAATAAYQSMLSVAELKLAGLKGLTQLALSRGDRTEAVRLAEEALAQPRPAMWAFRTLIDARLANGDWADAIALIDGALSRKLISPIYSERAKAALMAATAARLKSDPSAKPDVAADMALRAAKQQPGFTPAAVLAAELLVARSKTGRAEDVLENAWAASPHPALWMSYRDLVSSETPAERAGRLTQLLDRNVNHAEGRILRLERALILGAADEIRTAIGLIEPDLGDEALTRRLCGLMARACLALRDQDGARMWVARALLAKRDPLWSDIDADGRAFGFSPSDWSVIVLDFARTGKLSHPRFEREDPVLPEVPELASRYVPSMPFVRAAQMRAGLSMPQPDDPGTEDDTESMVTSRPTRSRARAARTSPKTPS